MERGARPALLALVVFLFFALLMAPGVHAETRTIDDTNGDSVTGQKPQYSDKQWLPQSINNCDICSQYVPDVNQVFDSTWHLSKHGGATVTFTFIGTSISVFFIVPTFGKLTSGSFTLDGTPAGSINIQPTNDRSHPFSLNQTVLFAGGLENIQHTLEIVVADGVVLFDYATYTFESPQPQPSSVTPSTASSDPDPATPVTSPDSSSTEAAPPPATSESSPVATGSTTEPSASSSASIPPTPTLVTRSISLTGTGTTGSLDATSSSSQGTIVKTATVIGAPTSGAAQPPPNAVTAGSTWFSSVSDFIPPTSHGELYPTALSPTSGGAATNAPGGAIASGTPGAGTASGSTQDTGARRRKPVPVGAIVGGVIVGLLLLALIVVFLVWRRRRRQHRTPPSAEFLQATESKRHDGSFAGAGGAGAAWFAEKNGLGVSTVVPAVTVPGVDAKVGLHTTSSTPTIAAARRAIQANAASPLARLSAGTDLPDPTDARGRAALLQDEVARTLSAYHTESGSGERTRAASPTPLAAAEQLQAAEAMASSAPKLPRGRFERTSLVSSLKSTWAI